MPSFVGKTFLHYKIVEQIGQGGMGVVYKAHDTKLDRTVAIKFLPHQISNNAEERQRFIIEAKSAAALNHPNIATIHSIEEADNEIFIVMEYVEGWELKNFIDIPLNPPSKGDFSSPALRSGDVLPIEKITNYAIQIAEGLQAAHKKGIVHRDIKSANIMITDEGKIKIMDFGLAQMGAGSQMTKIGTTVGTTAYMSPEQARGDIADERSDIWSFGIVLYELLTGELPFKGAYEQSILYSVINEDPEPVSQLRQNISTTLQKIVTKCLNKNPDQRYLSFSEVISELQKKDIKSWDNTDLDFDDQQKSNFQLQNFLLRKRMIILIPILIVFLVCMAMIFSPSRQIIANLFNFDRVPQKQHLLVLPLKNIGGDPNQQALCDGLVETLTSKLSQLEQYHNSLWVVPASEVQQNNIKSASEAQKLFGVNLAVSGSLQILNDIYRLTLNLIDTKSLRQLHSSIIDIKASSLTKLQDQSVVKMLEMLSLELKPEFQEVLRAGGTTVPGAYEFYLQGNGYLQRYENVENLDASITLFEKAIQQDSNFALAYAGLGEAYWRKYETSKETQWINHALRNCETAIQIDKQLAPANVTQGNIYTGMGKYHKALESFQKALAFDPANANAYRGMAKAFEASGELEKAESTYMRAIQLKPDYWAGYNDLGVFYFKNSRYKKAIEQFKQVIELTPDNYRGYSNLGGMYYFLERWSEARKMFEKAFEIKKTYQVASNLATLYYIEGNFAEAARVYEIALDLSSHDFVVWGNLASTYYRLPNMGEKAIKTYYRAIELGEERRSINPSDPDVLSNLAGYYSMVGDSSKAVELVEQAIQLDPDDARIMYQTGTTYEQLGNRELAIQWIGEALENGYSKSEIENQPELRELIADARFQKILKNVPQK